MGAKYAAGRWAQSKSLDGLSGKGGVASGSDFIPMNITEEVGPPTVEEQCEAEKVEAEFIRTQEPG